MLKLSASNAIEHHRVCSSVNAGKYRIDVILYDDLSFNVVAGKPDQMENIASGYFVTYEIEGIQLLK